MSPGSTPSKPLIALLIHSMNDGGAQKRVVSLANGFAARGHAVDLLAVEGAGEVGRLASPAGPPDRVAGARRATGAARRRRAGRAQGLSRARAAGGADGGVEPRACHRRAGLCRNARSAVARAARGAASAASSAVVEAVEAGPRIWAAADRALGDGRRRPDHRGQPGKRGGDRGAGRRPDARSSPSPIRRSPRASAPRSPRASSIAGSTRPRRGANR